MLTSRTLSSESFGTKHRRQSVFFVNDEKKQSAKRIYDGADIKKVEALANLIQRGSFKEAGELIRSDDNARATIFRAYLDGKMTSDNFMFLMMFEHYIRSFPNSPATMENLKSLSSLPDDQHHFSESDRENIEKTFEARANYLTCLNASETPVILLFEPPDAEGSEDDVTIILINNGTRMLRCTTNFVDVAVTSEHQTTMAILSPQILNHALQSELGCTPVGYAFYPDDALTFSMQLEAQRDNRRLVSFSLEQEMDFPIHNRQKPTDFCRIFHDFFHMRQIAEISDKFFEDVRVLTTSYRTIYPEGQVDSVYHQLVDLNFSPKDEALEQDWIQIIFERLKASFNLQSRIFEKTLLGLIVAANSEKLRSITISPELASAKECLASVNNNPLAGAALKLLENYSREYKKTEAYDAIKLIKAKPELVTVEGFSPDILDCERSDTPTNICLYFDQALIFEERLSTDRSTSNYTSFHLDEVRAKTSCRMM